MSEKKIELIAQLLAKAEQTTPEEAEALTEHATRLMSKYMIDQAVIDERRAKKGEASEKIVEHMVEFTGAYRGEMLHLVKMVAYGLGSVRVMQYTGGAGKVFKAWIVGYESDVKQAEVMLASLQVQALVALRAYWQHSRDAWKSDSSYNQEKARRSFYHGFGTGAGTRMRENRQTIVETVSKTNALVLVSREERVQAHIEGISKATARARNATASGEATGHGYLAGRKANTGEREVSQGRGIEA